MPVELELLGNILDRSRSASLSDVMGKAFGIERVASNEVDSFALHAITDFAVNTSDFEFKINSRITAGEVPHPS